MKGLGDPGQSEGASGEGVHLGVANRENAFLATEFLLLMGTMLKGCFQGDKAVLSRQNHEQLGAHRERARLDAKSARRGGPPTYCLLGNSKECVLSCSTPTRVAKCAAKFYRKLGHFPDASSGAIEGVFSRPAGATATCSLRHPSVEEDDATARRPNGPTVNSQGRQSLVRRT